MLDIDHFKAFNDQHGHPSGDRLLRSAAAAWHDCLRDSDLIARYGGEEFSLILTNLELATAVRVLEWLRAATPDAQTCSIGVALWDGHETAISLVARADALVYCAKQSGRNRVLAADQG